MRRSTRWKKHYFWETAAGTIYTDPGTAPTRGYTAIGADGTETLIRLDFEEPDADRFPSIYHARRAGKVGGTLPAVLNAANEVAVQAFCDKQINFTDITRIVAQTMEIHDDS